MLLILIFTGISLIGLFLATFVYRRSWQDWPLNIGVPMFLFGAIASVALLILGFAGTLWDFVCCEGPAYV